MVKLENLLRHFRFSDDVTFFVLFEYVIKNIYICVFQAIVVSIELALIYFRHYTRMISFVSMVYLQI